MDKGGSGNHGDGIDGYFSGDADGEGILDTVVNLSDLACLFWCQSA